MPAAKVTYIREVSDQAERLEGNFYQKEYGEKIPPETMQFDHSDYGPDFTIEKPLASWKQKTDLYGVIDVEVFPSKSGDVKFMFCRDELGRVWCGGIEGPGEIGSTGLKKKWIYGGDLTTPAFEYVSQSGEYGNTDLRGGTRGEYVDMSKNYNSKMPINREYLKMRHPELMLADFLDYTDRLDIKDFEKLYDELKKSEKLHTTKRGRDLTPEKLIKMIDDVRTGIRDVGEIPRTHKLRDKVKSLLKSDAELLAQIREELREV